jgi:hypothetical protein
MNISPEHISALEPGQIFVFGSNLGGRHGKGAALFAIRNFGAIYGQASGLQGQSYAIPTKDNDHPMRPLELHVVDAYVVTFLTFARVHPEFTFVCTAIGCGLAEFSPARIAPLFLKRNRKLPENVWLPEAFHRAVAPVDSSVH